jgi:hypothetical protein
MTGFGAAVSARILGRWRAVARQELLLAFALLTALPGHARASAGETCRDQAAIAERIAGIPPGLLLAIGKRESGRVDPQTGGVLPWPWAVNRDGEGHVFETLEQAVAFVAAAQREGSRSVDVGCFQINLKSHPDAFSSLEEAFDPTANANYAARFLSELYRRQGSWESAVATYHSATPGLGQPYSNAVLDIWHGLDAPSLAPFMGPGPVRVEMGIRIWEPTSGYTSPPMKPVAVASWKEPTQTPASTPRRDLPRVITPLTPPTPPSSSARAAK